MSKASTKTNTAQQFKPREILTPSKDQHGITKTVYSHVLQLHGSLVDWLKMKDKGVRLCKAISSLKLYECVDYYYPSQLRPLMEGLSEIMDSLKNVIYVINTINDQFQALAKWQPANDPLISTWSVNRISKCVMEISEMLKKEYRLKNIITENVAHCRDEKLIEVYLTAWEFEVYFQFQSYAYLFAEVGLAVDVI